MESEYLETIGQRLTVAFLSTGLLSTIHLVLGITIGLLNILILAPIIKEKYFTKEK